MKSLLKTLLAVYLLILAWLVLFKFSIHLSSVSDQTRSLNLTPFADTSRGNLNQVIYNFVVFIPFGLFLSVNLKQVGFWRKLAFIFMFSVVAEIIQFIFAIGATDITDVITNTSGGLVGLLIYDLGKKCIDDEELDQLIFVVGAGLLLLFILLASILLSHGVRYQSAPPGEIPRLRR